MQLADLVAATDAVSATSARKAKIALLAGLLRNCAAEEAAVVVGLIAGQPRQGRIGIGWATLAGVAPAPATSPTAKVGDLDALLDAIAQTHGAGSQADKELLLTEFLGRLTPAEADFVRRLLIGELRQGASAGIVVEAIASAAAVAPKVMRRAVMLSGDLGTAASIAFAEGSEGLEAVGLVVLRPLQPMLASKAESVEEALAELGRASVEWKLDGVRIQVHRNGDDVRVWTRNLNEITDGVPEVVATVIQLPAQQLVLDGEVLGIDSDGRPLAFQDTVRANRSVAPFFFDILHHDGTDLLDAPLELRRRRLRAIVGDLTIPGEITTDTAVGEAVLARALDQGHEGVVVKAADSPYQAGRRGKSWRKVKPVHTLDLVVLAVEPGSGRRTGWLSNIHLGARGPDGTFVMVGKTFKGMTDDILRWQTSRFSELATRTEIHVVHVRHEQVVEIAVDGIQRSTRYPGGVALRFARVVRYRHDKSAAEADTIDDVRSLGDRSTAH